MSGENKTNKKQSLHVTFSGSTELTASLSMRSNLSAWHIIAAANFARNAWQIETANSGKPFGDFYQEIASNVMAAVFFAVAALEANINELFKDSDKSIPEQNQELAEEIWNLFEQKKSILEKYDLALLLKGKKRLDKSISVYQNAEGLIILRNELVHFKPEWSYEQKKHKRIENWLTGKFQLSPFLTSEATFFPKRIMSHGCAEWAVKTALEFRTHFSNVSGLSDSFAPYHSRLITR